MREDEIKQSGGRHFHLNKWFLDFVGKNGAAMIFYAAKLTWYGWSASYTSWLWHDPGSGVSLKTRFRNVHMPLINDDIITWKDTGFGVSGIWESSAKTVSARLFDSEEGFLDWMCYQPASKVKLRIKENILEGRGYAEQLILTVPPWKIPMDELRWGRFGSDENNMVWIELRDKDKKQWLWLNGEKIGNCIIEDEQIILPGKDLVLNLDKGILLESEKKIFTVVEKLIRYIPGFNKIMPVNFLLADEFKWLSWGQLETTNRKVISSGMAIHELVNFKAH
jgi:hypothetical protein